MLELLFEMVGETGFEPATPCSQSRCATRLRHAPTLVKRGAMIRTPYSGVNYTPVRCLSVVF